MTFRVEEGLGNEGVPLRLFTKRGEGVYVSGDLFICVQTQRLNTNSNATDGYFDDGEANAEENGEIFIKASHIQGWH